MRNTIEKIMRYKFWSRGSLLWTRNRALALSKNLDGNISAFVSRIRKSSDSVRIEYLHVTRFKLHHKTFVKMQEFEDFADYVDQLIHLSHGFIQISCSA